MKTSFLMTALLCAALPTSSDSGEVQSTIKTGYVEVGKYSLYYEETGEGNPLIMIHGGLLDRRMWDDQFELFGKWARVIRYDVRNHGLSHGEPDTSSHVEDLNRLMDALGVKKARLMGLSMGGFIAIDFTLVHPERVSALVLASSGLTGYDFKDSSLKENEKKLMEAAGKGDLNMYVEVFQQAWTDGPYRSPAQVDSSVRKKVQAMARGTLANWDPRNLLRELTPPAIKRLSEIRVPTLCVAGDLDMPGILEIADIVCRDVRGARKVMITRAAHMVNMEKPKEFNEVVVEFLTR